VSRLASTSPLLRRLTNAAITDSYLATTQMFKFGRAFSVLMACGHKFRATREEAARDQVFIGKVVRSKECEK
jgi:hypothetical protein